MMNSFVTVTRHNGQKTSEENLHFQLFESEHGKRQNALS